MESMKKLLFISFMLLTSLCFATAQSKMAEIKFDKVVHNFGKFSEKNPTQKCVFKFKNTGDAPLVINQAIGSCGCTVPTYTKTPIKPGGEGELSVTYNGRNRALGHFKKTITVRTNGVTEMIRLYIEGEMTAAE